MEWARALQPMVRPQLFKILCPHPKMGFLLSFGQTAGRLGFSRAVPQRLPLGVVRPTFRVR